MSKKLQNIVESEGGGALSVVSEGVRLNMLKSIKAKKHSKRELIIGSMGPQSSIGAMTTLLNIDGVRREEPSSYSETAQQIRIRKAEEKRLRKKS